MKDLDFPLLHRELSKELVRVGFSVMDFYAKPFRVSYKRDRSPVTQADIMVESSIKAFLGDLTPHIPVFGEESFRLGTAPTTSRYWLIDPIDGTKSFVAKDNIFTINVGLIEARKPVFGIVYSPLTKQLYVGSPLGSFVNGATIKTRALPSLGIVVASNTVLGKDIKVQQFLKRYTVTAHLGLSSSIKICRIAEGVADIYPKFGPTCEWDTAAGHAVLRYAGGSIKTTDGLELQYGKPNFANGWFVCLGDTGHTPFVESL